LQLYVVWVPEVGPALHAGEAAEVAAGASRAIAAPTALRLANTAEAPTARLNDRLRASLREFPKGPFLLATPIASKSTDSQGQ
jgi:hypothetical protein